MRSRSCAVAGLDISGVELSGSDNGEVIMWHMKKYV